MKSQSRTVHAISLSWMAAAALLSVSPGQLTAQSWSSLFEIEGAAHNAIAIDPFSLEPAVPNLIIAGDVAGVQNGFLHGFSQADSALVPLDPDNSVGWRLYGLGFNLASPSIPGYGTLFSVGYFNRSRSDGSTMPTWSVRRGIQNGSAWELVDSFVMADAWSEARGIATDDLGNTYVCGMATDASGIHHWIVRKSSDQGATWITKDLFHGSAAASVITGNNWVTAFGICFVPNANAPGGTLFCVGSRGRRYAGSWTVLRSTNYGETWDIVDSDSWVAKGGSSRARKVAADSQGRIFVLGDTGSRGEVDPSPWVVRMSDKGGAPGSWKTIFGPWNFGPCPYPLDLAIAPGGDVWSVGAIHKQYGTKNATYTTQGACVRLSETAPGSGSWNPTYGFVTPEAQGINRAGARAVAADSAGAVYVSGQVQLTPSSPRQWFVKRTAP